MDLKTCLEPSIHPDAGVSDDSMCWWPFVILVIVNGSKKAAIKPLKNLLKAQDQDLIKDVS